MIKRLAELCAGALFVLLVGPVSAAPNVCDVNFCDQDGDGWYRVHNKWCPNCELSEGPDCDDNDEFAWYPEDCDSGTVSTVYTAELTEGAFMFDTTDPIPVTTYNNKELGLDSLSNVTMSRPTQPQGEEGESGYRTVLELQATWDRWFEIGCPELGTSSTYTIGEIFSTYDNWDFSEPGNTRLVLRDIRLQSDGGIDWDVTVQLIGAEDYNPEFLPADGFCNEFILVRGRMWGREVNGGPGGRKSCHQLRSGPDDKMEGFFLCDPAATCTNDARSVMRICNPAD